MNRKHTIMSHLKLCLYTILFWIGAFVLYDLFRYVGLSDLPGISVPEEVSGIKSLELFLVLGFFTGLIYFFIEEVFDIEQIRRRPIGFRILIKTLFYFFILTIDIEVGVNVLVGMYDHPHLYTPEELMESGAIWSFIIYFMVCSLLFSFIKVILEKFGRGVFWKMLIGKYTPPRIENKLFMFLDMKSSTAIAEELGYQKFSELIQQCFYDLNAVVTGYSGEIFQYVGDEAVIIWDYEKGVKNNECIDLYFDFMNKLQQRKEFYMNRFGVQPEFKAGMHGGELVAAEVGVVKKEIAYHGDVINTTARIQDMCNKLGERILVSDMVFRELTPGNLYQSDFKGEFVLKGKGDATLIYGVRQQAT